MFKIVSLEIYGIPYLSLLPTEVTSVKLISSFEFPFFKKASQKGVVIRAYYGLFERMVIREYPFPQPHWIRGDVNFIKFY
jgi:hypothetical protein